MIKNMDRLSSATITAILVLSIFSAQAHADYSFNFDGVSSGTSANDSAENHYTNVLF